MSNFAEFKYSNGVHELRPYFALGGCCSVDYTLAIESYINELPTVSPSYSYRQANLLVVSGVITTKVMDLIKFWYDEMERPRWIMSIGSCTISGGVFESKDNQLCKLSEYIPVDVEVLGCPPSTSDVFQGFEQLMNIVSRGRVRE